MLNWATGIDMYTLMCIKLMPNKKLQYKKTNKQTKKWAKDLNRHFSRDEDMHMARKCMKKTLNITNHQENANQNLIHY